MGRTKDKVIREQERQALDSLHDAKYWEVLDTQYEEYQALQETVNQELANDDENEFITEYSKQKKEEKKCVE